MFMRVIDFIVLYIVLTVAFSCGVYHQNFNEYPTIVTIVLVFFLNLNILICVWEISLGLNIKHIFKDHEELRTKYENKFDAVVAYMTETLTFSKLFSLRFWSKIWSK